MWGRAQAPTPCPASQGSVARGGSPRRRAAAAGRAAEANFAEWLFFKNNFAFVSRSGLLQIEQSQPPSPALLPGARWQPQPGMCRVGAGPQRPGEHRCPRGSSGSSGTLCAAPPTLPPPKAAAAGDALSSDPRAGLGVPGELSRNGSARGRNHRVFAKAAESRSNCSSNVSTVLAGMKDAHMSRGRELTRSPPAERKEQIRLPFVGSRECAPALEGAWG